MLLHEVIQLTGIKLLTYFRAQTQLSTPFYSKLILCICAATNKLGGGAQTDFVPGRGKH